MPDWYRKDTTEVVSLLNTDATAGLAAAEAQRRQAEYGPNELVERGARSPWRIVWEQLTGMMVVILIIAAIVSGAVGDWKDAIAILAIVVLNAILGFSQEFRAEKAMAALKQLAVPTVRARRRPDDASGGTVVEISARELVPGDVVLIEAGALVPADGRLLESANLRVEEAALTGESEPVEKQAGALDKPDLPLGDRRNMVYMGTVVTYGRGAAVITATGMATELGRIAELIQGVEREPTPLQRRLEQLGRGLAVAALGIVAIVFVLGLLRGEDWQLMLLTAISMAVAAVPEGLPAVVTIALALGAQRMLKRQALIRKLPAVETLGSVTVICSDKTGTLTENRMTVTVLDVLGETQQVDTLLEQGIPVADADLLPGHRPEVRSLGLLAKAAALCNDATLEPTAEGGYRAVGDPTEGALVVAAAELGLVKDELDRRWPRAGEVPFTSERKRMTTVHRVGVTPEQTDAPWCCGELVAFSKGAVDSLLDISERVWTGDEEVLLTDEMRARILQANDRLAGQGQRVLGVAFRPLDGPVDEMPGDLFDEEMLEREMTFIGLVGMIDPPRPEVRGAVAMAKAAGIRPVMITGDHPLTARQIAWELGITDEGQPLTGRDLAAMSVDDLEGVVGDVAVYARVSPEHKLKIVQALQERGQIVAMTGDGVNDAPALKRADIGVAMGITGTDVSKEAADMVLLDDNFATIVAAVKEGRTIYDNIRKFIKYTLTSNAGEIWVMLLAPLAGMPLPLLPLQILWINLVTDGLPGLAMGVEPAERDTMHRPPYHPQENIFGRGLGRHVLWVGLLMGLVSLGMGYWTWRAGWDNWQTMIFVTLTLSQMGHALAVRSRESLFQVGLLSNVALLGAVALTFVLQLAVVYVPFLQDLFKTQTLSLGELLISLLLSTVVFWGVELEKWLMRRGKEAQPPSSRSSGRFGHKFKDEVKK
ncbi:MAG: cation-translocating P-type ATPase [Anaerolineae bacterium]|nr:cation-translocating P-type ATPase [Anaerolineae bacterium]